MRDFRLPSQSTWELRSFGLIGSESEFQVINYKYTVRNNPEERSSPFYWYRLWNIDENKILY